MIIRTATADDIPVMAELLHQLFAIEVDFTPNYALQTEGLSLLLERSSAQIFVAEKEGQVIGMCTVQVLVSTTKGREVGVVEDVVIDIGCRSEGIGSALLHTLEEWAADRGLARLQLQADLDNHPALGFYRHEDWQPTNLIGWTKHL